MTAPLPTHTVWMNENDDGWQAICECGWQSRWFRADAYDETEEDMTDPKDTAYGYADLAGQIHQLDNAPHTTPRKRPPVTHEESELIRSALLAYSSVLETVAASHLTEDAPLKERAADARVLADRIKYGQWSR